MSKYELKEIKTTTPPITFFYTQLRNAISTVNTVLAKHGLRVSVGVISTLARSTAAMSVGSHREVFGRLKPRDAAFPKGIA